MFSYDPPQDFLEDRTILITGASDGIGKTCACTFARYGARLILLGRSREKLEQVYDEIEADNPGQLIILPMDFATSRSEDFVQLAEHFGEQFQSLDGLIHNAALLGARTPIEFYPEQDWDSLMAVNVNAAFYLTRSLLPALASADSGRIIFTSSSVGRQGRAYWGAYGVSKFAVEGLMQTLADELGATSNIRVNSLNPGATRTAMRRAAYPAENPETLPTPESLMPVYLYLLSDEARHINGAAINVRDFDPSEYG